MEAGLPDSCPAHPSTVGYRCIFIARKTDRIAKAIFAVQVFDVKIPFHMLFGVGAALFTLNLSGLLYPVRSPKAPPRAAETALERIVEHGPRNAKDFAEATTPAVARAVGRYWLDEDIDGAELRISPRENYLLFLAGFVDPTRFRKYEFTDYRRAVRRGIGLCSQRAIVAAGILLEGGIPASIVGLQGHVVVQAQVDQTHDEWWVIDADRGVVVPMSLPEIEKNPEAIVPYYRAAGYPDEDNAALVKIYGPEGNVVLPPDGARSYAPRNYFIEKMTYVLIWLIPAMMMAGGATLDAVRRAVAAGGTGISRVSRAECARV
jgi:hypothetical protein